MFSQQWDQKWRDSAKDTIPADRRDGHLDRVKTRRNATEHGGNLHGRKWKVPEVQLRRLATRRREASLARTAIASADEANGWLKPEKTEEEKEGEERGQGRGRDSR